VLFAVLSQQALQGGGEADSAGDGERVTRLLDILEPLVLVAPPPSEAQVASAPTLPTPAPAVAASTEEEDVLFVAAHSACEAGEETSVAAPAKTEDLEDALDAIAGDVSVALDSRTAS
jgi:hypothetical protein